MQEFDSMTVKEIRNWLGHSQVHISNQLIEKLRLDSRKGVRQLAIALEQRFVQQLEERKRLHRLFHYERQIKGQGYSVIAGVDEAGRGPLAGPVVAAAVILPEGYSLSGLNDSKKLTKHQRDKLYCDIIKQAISIGIGRVDSETIDRINILQATYFAMQKAINNLTSSPDYLLVDGSPIPNSGFAQRGLINGDQKSASIASASIIAKVTRDRIMEELDGVYPNYGFCRHKGYGTKEHVLAMKRHGITPIHRTSFAPVAEILRFTSISK